MINQTDTVRMRLVFAMLRIAEKLKGKALRVGIEGPKECTGHNGTMRQCGCRGGKHRHAASIREIRLEFNLRRDRRKRQTRRHEIWTPKKMGARRLLGDTENHIRALQET